MSMRFKFQLQLSFPVTSLQGLDAVMQFKIRQLKPEQVMAIRVSKNGCHKHHTRKNCVQSASATELGPIKKKLKLLKEEFNIF